MADSTITVVGNLTKDPEIRFTASGRGNVNFGIAVNRRWQQNGEWQEQTSFFNVVAWGSLGENAAASLHKGYRVIVTGRLEQRSYEAQSGEKRSIVEIVADEIGPSLRWARADVEKVSREGGQSSGGGYGGGGGAGGGFGGGAPAANRAPDPVYGDEEPF